MRFRYKTVLHEQKLSRKIFYVLTDMDINYPTGCFDLKCSSAGACR